MWASDSVRAWSAALEAYDAVVDQQGVKALVELDRWYREELPAAISARDPMHATHAELVRVTEWKMARGVWRARNLGLVRGNDPALVERTSRDALAAIPEPKAPVAELATLAGVGPATASGIVSAAAPNLYPFFDELVAAQVPEFGAVKFSLGEYVRYAAALRERSRRLGPEWTPVMVERALWSHVGGKAGARRTNSV
ncbi:MAG: hypothetical protein KY464_06485 [Gemmatimonadetes bacterium]|nr:hypothetical protein [Gemmatimonadota bacterium]